MILVARPSIRRKDMDAVLSCMVTDNLGPGSLSDQLCDSVAAYLSLAGGIALRERTRAIGVALDHLGLPPGSSVVLDPLAPHSYHEQVLARGLEPVYADVQGDTVAIDPGRVGSLVEEREGGEHPVSVIIAQSHLGYVPALAELASLGVPLIEDVSEALGANTGEDRVGQFGRYTIVALEPDDIITAGGGCLLLAKSRSDRAALRRTADALPPDTLLPDMNAALGTIQIKEIEKYIARRAEIASVFHRALMRGKHQSLVQTGDAQNVHFGFPVIVEGSVAESAAYARKKGVETNLAFAGSALDTFGRPERGLGEVGEEPDEHDETPDEAHLLSESEYPHARAFLLRLVLFPLYPSLTNRETATIERVLSTLP